MISPRLKAIVGSWGSKSTLSIHTWWVNKGPALLRLACVIMAILAALKLGDEFRRLIWEPGPTGAIDLRLLHQLVHEWFDGKPVYQELHSAIQPPATYVLLWPFLGWLDLTPARWLWAVTSGAALGCLVYLLVRESGAETRLERAFVALIPLSMNATGVVIGNGQLIAHLLPALLFALLLLRQNRWEWHIDLLAAGMLLFALVKPSVSAPFFWMAYLPGRSVKTALLVPLGYVGLTLFAASFQESGLTILLRGWVARGTVVAGAGGYANLHRWLATRGLEQGILPASLLVLLALGLWMCRHRKRDFWLLLGITAIAARFWTYHRVYDDLLIVLPMVALFRIAKQDTSAHASGVVAGLLLATTVVAMLAPARLEFFPSPWSLFFTCGHALVWIAVLAFLLYQARRTPDSEAA